MKQILPWILVIVFGAATAIQFTQSQKKDLDLATMRSQLKEMENRGETDGGRKGNIDPNDVERLRKESEEVYKLRNQIAQLQKKLKEMPAAVPGNPGEQQADDHGHNSGSAAGKIR